MVLTLHCLKEDDPGEKWQALFYKAWPYYRHWFLSEGISARRGYLTSANALQHYMPELVPVYEKLARLAGGGDIEARFLSMYCPPAYMTGCSQMACKRKKVFLVRNYDYSPALFEGNQLYTKWLKPVIGIGDCTWGLLDGMNADGLAASLSFGGRNTFGEGFGIPLVIRYLLETASTVSEAIAKLTPVPVHMVYNITLADASGEFATVYLAPDRAPVVTSSPVSTNHQQVVEWPEYAAVTATVERKQALEKMQADCDEDELSIVQKFLEPPLFNYNYKLNFGTLYTINYLLTDKQMRIYWPGNRVIEQSFTQFKEDVITIPLPVNRVVI